MSATRLWILKEPYEFKDARKAYLIGKQFKLLTGGEMIDAIRNFNLSLPGNGPWPDALPSNFPRPILRMPLEELPLLAPDFFDLSWLFVSRRMREAMALPDWAVSYVPAEIETGSRLARLQDYALMYPRAFAPVIDPEASECRVNTFTSAKTGDTITDISGVGVMRFKADMKVPADLFFDPMGGQVYVLATDALAKRVLDAGCTGIQFEHPLWFHAPFGNYIIRTRDGIGHIQWDAEGQSFEIVPVSPEEADAGPQTDAA